MACAHGNVIKLGAPPASCGCGAPGPLVQIRLLVSAEAGLSHSVIGDYIREAIENYSGCFDGDDPRRSIHIDTIQRTGWVDIETERFEDEVTGRAPVLGTNSVVQAANQLSPQLFVVLLDQLRAAGWMIAVHNDYRQNGKLMTFWLFVREGIAVKGEGATDAEALAKVAAQIEWTL